MQNLHVFVYCQILDPSSDHHLSVSTQLKQPVRLVHLHGEAGSARHEHVILSGTNQQKYRR